MALLSWALSNGLLLVDESAFDRLGTALDRPSAAWLEALVGYFFIIGVAIALRRANDATLLPRIGLPLSLLALVAFGFHQYTMRWPWLTGTLPPLDRADHMAAVLSATWHGVPVIAFGELLGTLVIGVHGYIGLCVAGPYARLRAANPKAHYVVTSVALLAYLLISCVVIGLATGRH